jgi:hypothetical protein
MTDSQIKAETARDVLQEKTETQAEKSYRLVEEALKNGEIDHKKYEQLKGRIEGEQLASSENLISAFNHIVYEIGAYRYHESLPLNASKEKASNEHKQGLLEGMATRFAAEWDDVTPNKVSVNQFDKLRDKYGVLDYKKIKSDSISRYSEVFSSINTIYTAHENKFKRFDY